MSTEAPTFDPRCSLPAFEDRDGNIHLNEPQVRLTFPDTQTAADFINQGLVGTRFADRPVTADYLRATRETPTGPKMQYDAFVSRPNRETGDVNMMIRHYGHHELEAHTALSEYVVDTVMRMAEADQV